MKKQLLILGIFMFTSVLLSSIFNSVVAQNEDIKKEIRQNVDWLWDQTDPPSQQSAWWKATLPSPEGSGLPAMPRMWRSGRACLLMGVLYRMTGDLGRARDCLIAGQVHNPNVVNQFRDNADYLMDYATDKYRNHALAWAGIQGAYPPAEIIGFLVNFLSKK
jgi:hypothetical protein